MNGDDENGKEKKRRRSSLQDYCNQETSCATKKHGGKMFVEEERATNTFIRPGIYKRETMQSRRKQIYDPIK